MTDPGRWVAGRWVPAPPKSLDELHTKWCKSCEAWHLRSCFGKEPKTTDGLKGSCLKHTNARWRQAYHARKERASQPRDVVD